MTPLHLLPHDHPDRRRPLKGCERRMYHKHGEDITIPPNQRGPEWVIWKWTKWNPLKPMKIERACYNDLGPTWTERNEFRFTDTK